MRLYDTATSSISELNVRDEGRVSMYVCGPTVYGPPHIGHGRFALVYDVLRRYLTYRGFVVRYVSNITDIDDKIILRANAEGRSWRSIVEECEQQWWQSVDALGVLRPDEAPRATAYIAEMNELIGELVASGHAYEAPDGVYLSVGSVTDYGLLAHQSLESLLSNSAARVEPGQDKISPADFALWKKAKPGEPAWDSPFGKGRPGWHTECVVMSLKLLGQGFDVHGGGLDLVFPHHENERAQAVALGRDFARRWVHNGLVLSSGEKMSKSLGNFLTLADLLERYDPRAYRLLVLRSHYRSEIEVSEATLADATSALERVDALARRFVGAPGPSTPESTELERQFILALDEDLDTPRAIAACFDAIRRANAAADGGDPLLGASLAHRVLELFSILGLEVVLRPDDADLTARELVKARDAARAAGDFAAADQLRDRLVRLGWRVEDTASGTRIFR